MVDRGDQSDEVDQKSPIFSEAQWTELTERLSLSRRQGEIVRCLFRGLADKQIARELGIAVPTVRTYLGKLFLRLDVQDRVELVLRILSQFLSQCRYRRCPLLRNDRS